LRNLVTGGEGFIASPLIDSLTKSGEYVICIDNLISGKEENIFHNFKHPNFRSINHDMINFIDIKINKIWHVVCTGSPVHYQKDPIQMPRIC
tara:strand:- start:228 stop:503 length:276 start_codon:yes stop_codon:yes gene_type:complete